MSLATPDLLNAISELVKIREMKVALNVSARCGIITSLATIAGGLIGGPPGIAFGGIIGTALASYHANGKFKSVPEILKNDTTLEQKEKLATAVRSILTAENILTVVQFVAAVQSNELLIHSVCKVVRDFMITDLGHQIL